MNDIFPKQLWNNAMLGEKIPIPYLTHILDFWAKEFTAAAGRMQNSSNELSTLVSGKV